MSSDQNPCDIPLYWLVNRDPYIGLLKSLSLSLYIYISSLIYSLHNQGQLVTAKMIFTLETNSGFNPWRSMVGRWFFGGDGLL